MPFLFAFSHIYNHISFFFLFIISEFAWLFWILAVVNLTLIDLPGLTKVAVGKLHLGFYSCVLVTRGLSSLLFFSLLRRQKRMNAIGIWNLWTSIFLLISAQFSLGRFDHFKIFLRVNYHKVKKYPPLIAAIFVDHSEVIF